MIAIIIPTFNERSNIFRLIKKLLKIDDNFNIYIIDDTKEYHLKEEFKKLNNVYYLHRKNQRGRGSAVINGLNITLKNKPILTNYVVDDVYELKKTYDFVSSFLSLPWFNYKKLFLIKSRQK